MTRSEALDRDEERVLNRQCSLPDEVQPGLFIRCKSRVKGKCPSCAELPGGTDQQLLIRARASGAAFSAFCAQTFICGDVDTVDDAGLHGVPRIVESGDCSSQFAWVVAVASFGIARDDESANGGIRPSSSSFGGGRTAERFKSKRYLESRAQSHRIVS